MSQLKLKKVISLFQEFVKQNKIRLEIILVGGLAAQYYGMKKRVTVDVDAEVNGEIEKLISFLKRKGIPADLSEDISRWSVISLPPGYKERAITVMKGKFLTVKVLNPLDFVIAKLRRFTEDDFEDALFVTKKFKLKFKDIQKTAQEAIKDSPKDTALFLFKKNLFFFLKHIG